MADKCCGGGAEKGKMKPKDKQQKGQEKPKPDAKPKF